MNFRGTAFGRYAPLAFVALTACEQSYGIAKVAGRGEPAPAGTNTSTPVPTPTPTATPPSPPLPPGSPENPVPLNPGSCARHTGHPLQGTGGHAGLYHAVITTDRATYAPGEPILVAWTGFPDMPSNWITIVPADFEDDSWCAWFWNESAPITQGVTQSGRVAGQSYFVISQAGT